ncbi:FHA domain-containing protein [Nocardia terpenica]|uniref:FHA domain-containing protein n=2 Tax=Nocardia terpenica TaxID=455432 RepID=A0A6G9ZEF2_9NOCA|nr:FHA domain-containing protein [Nocardia terpenica]
MDRQVEVVAGNHVVVRVAGAVVVVAHRERGRVTAESAAVRVAEALAQLITAAAERAPDGPGRLVAREVTGWLMREAARFGGRVDLGIVSPADSGAVAVFLHGAVTAVLVGDRGTEYIRGVDAAFTVDRVIEPPTIALAAFADDDHGRIPPLPERGIGSLSEGVAPASGAIVWFDGERTRARNRPRPNSGAHRRPEDIPQSPPPREFDGSARGESYPAPTDQIPDARRGSSAAGADPDFERRLEATAKATTVLVKVRGFKCARAHPSDPRSAFCTVCGMPVDQTQPAAEVVRPPLGMLMLDDGTTHLLASDVVIGREPENSDAAQRGLIPIKIDDSSGGMSRAHAEIRLVNWDVTVVDRGSTNGTRARQPGYHDWIRLQPNQPVVLAHGSELMLGNRLLRYEPASPPPFA